MATTPFVRITLSQSSDDGQVIGTTQAKALREYVIAGMEAESAIHNFNFSVNESTCPLDTIFVQKSKGFHHEIVVKRALSVIDSSRNASFCESNKPVTVFFKEM